MADLIVRSTRPAPSGIVLENRTIEVQLPPAEYSAAQARAPASADAIPARAALGQAAAQHHVFKRQAAPSPRRIRFVGDREKPKGGNIGGAFERGAIALDGDVPRDNRQRRGTIRGIVRRVEHICARTQPYHRTRGKAVGLAHSRNQRGGIPRRYLIDRLRMRSPGDEQ